MFELFGSEIHGRFLSIETNGLSKKIHTLQKFYRYCFAMLTQNYFML